MKACWLKPLILILALSVPVTAGVIQKIEFDTDRIELDPAHKTVSYDSLERIEDPGHPGVPFQQLYFTAANSYKAIKISPVVILSDTVAIDFAPALSDSDRITADIDYPVVQPVILDADDHCYPSQPVRISLQTINDRVVWSVQVFPVQYLDDGRIIFNRLIEFATEDNDDLAISCGLDDDLFENIQREAYARVSSPPDENGCPLGHQYIVVTSPEMAAAFEEFIDLKRQTGFDAAIAITDSIFAYYSGIDEAEALRNYLKDFHNAGGTYVLLGGDENHVPIRYAFYYNTDSIPGPEALMICDLYFSDLNGDWDADHDGVWGEPTADSPDLGAEVALGRLPFSEPSQVATYTEKLRNYLFNPGGGDREYLKRAVFFTSDQMLDYFEDQGQQDYVAQYFPADMDVDCDDLAESPAGFAPNPTGPFQSDAIAGLDNGYGMVSILAHGRPDGFVLSSNEYNLFPKSYLLTGEEFIGHGAFDDLAANQKIGFYYTIACNQGSIDLESVYDMQVPSVVEKLLDLDSAGAVGVIGFSRWGWVGSSYRLMASFYEHLFGDADGYPIEAMYRTYLDYPYYLDQIYGQNYNGDPSLRLYRNIPDEIHLTVPDYYTPGQPLYCRLTLNGEALAGRTVTFKIGDDQYQSIVTDGDGYASVGMALECAENVEITAYIPGLVSASSIVYPSIAADADDDDPIIPDEFELRQNYPNPFNPTTTIEFTLTRHQPVSLDIYDILGRKVTSLIDENLSAGAYQVVWDGTDFDGRETASGIYFYRITSEEGVAVRKMALVR